MIISELLKKLDEKVARLPSDVDPEEALDILSQRLIAARRGLGFANRLQNPTLKKKHQSAVMMNLNVIRQQLGEVIRQMEQFTRAEQSHEEMSDLDVPRQY